MGFISFMFCSVLHMILILILQKRLKESKSSVQTSKSYFFKSLSFMIHILSFMTAMYFYWRHNAYCEPYGELLWHTYEKWFFFSIYSFNFYDDDDSLKLKQSTVNLLFVSILQFYRILLFTQLLYLSSLGTPMLLVQFTKKKMDELFLFIFFFLYYYYLSIYHKHYVFF